MAGIADIKGEGRTEEGYILNYGEDGKAVSSQGYWNLAENSDFGNDLHVVRDISIPVDISGHNGNPDLCIVAPRDNFDVPLEGKYNDKHFEHLIKGNGVFIDVTAVSPEPMYSVLEPVSSGKAKLNVLLSEIDASTEDPTVDRDVTE